jgi:hypothetical protein
MGMDGNVRMSFFPLAFISLYNTTLSFLIFGGPMLSSVCTILLFISFFVSTQVERYGPYTAVYGHFTDRITAVYCENAASYTVPFYCALDYEKIRSVYGAVLSKFMVKIRIAESINLGNLWFMLLIESSIIITSAVITCQSIICLMLTLVEIRVRTLHPHVD